METVSAEIASYVSTLIKGSEYYLVEVKYLPGNLIRVFIDSDNGITIDKCAEYNRKLQELLDSNKLVGEKYILEVSSPGIGQPLKLKRQYIKNVGRMVLVTLNDSNVHKGVLKNVKEDHIILSLKNKDKKISQSISTKIAFSDIKETTVVINISNKKK